MREAPRRILLVRLSAIGDVVRTLPALEALRRAQPDAHIAWLVEDRAAAVVRNHPALDAVYVFERKRISTHLRRPWQWGKLCQELLALVAELRRRPYDVVIDFQSLLKSGLLARATGAHLRLGFTPDHCREPMNAPHLNAHVDPGDARLPRGERNLRFIAHFISPEQQQNGATWHDTDQATQWAKEVAAELDGPPILLHPGTSRREKWWTPSGWAELGDALIRATGQPVSLTWGPGEREAADAVAMRMSYGGAVAPETPSLHHLVALIRRGACFITTDNGPMHLAALTDTPVVGLFGPVDVRINQPATSRMRCVCAGGVFGPGDDMPAYGGAMADIRPGNVITAALELLPRAGEQAQPAA